MRYLGAAWQQTLSPHEKRSGWVIFGLYLFVLPFLMSAVVRLLDERLDLWLTPAEANAIYYALVLILLAAVFWDFLLRSGVELMRDPHHGLIALVLSLVVGVVSTCLVGLIPLPVENPVIADYAGQMTLSPVFVVLMVLLRGCAEEILYRGLLFSTLRAHHTILAYALSTLLFALGTVWQYAPLGGVSYLTLVLHYLPMGLCLSWAMDVTESIFIPMFVRMGMGVLFLTLAVNFG